MPNEMTTAYLEVAFWTENESFKEDGYPHVEAKWSQAAIISAEKVCNKFYEYNADLIEVLSKSKEYNPESSVLQRAGHDLWLTRNGHGTGFWDRSMGEVGEKLAKAASNLSQSYVYVSDDGFLEVS